MKLGLVQLDILWEDVTGNIASVRRLLETVNPGDIDLLVLPELWTCGFTMNQLAHRTFDAGIAYMHEVSKSLGCRVLGGLPRKTETGQENRCYVVDGDQRRHYAKIKAFKYAGEHKKYEQGNIRRRWNLGPFTLSPFICYDLRFPELPRECMPDANLLCYVACWPKARVHHWRQLLIARAIENQCYVVGVNRVGRDGAGLDYSGSSLVVDPLGAIVLDAGDQEGLYHAEIDANLATETRERFPFLRDL